MHHPGIKAGAGFVGSQIKAFLLGSVSFYDFSPARGIFSPSRGIKFPYSALREELKNMSTVAIFAIVQNEGGRLVNRNIEFYNLDMVLSVGYRVKSDRGIKFRQWANRVLKEYLSKGYAM